MGPSGTPWSGRDGQRGEQERARGERQYERAQSNRRPLHSIHLLVMSGSPPVVGGAYVGVISEPAATARLNTKSRSTDRRRRSGRGVSGGVEGAASKRLRTCRPSRKRKTRLRPAPPTRTGLFERVERPPTALPLLASFASRVPWISLPPIPPDGCGMGAAATAISPKTVELRYGSRLAVTRTPITPPALAGVTSR